MNIIHVIGILLKMKKLIIIIFSISLGGSLFSQDTRSAKEARGLEIGAIAPEFSAIAADSTRFQLNEALKDGPVVMLFYRGFWCPVCNKHLAQIQDSLTLITYQGATVVAISPEKPEYLNIMAENTGASFRLLYDEDYKISDAYDVTFTPKRTELVVYNATLRARLKETHSDDSQRLPIPATYIISESGEIIWRQFNPDYKKRSTVKNILENLPE